ncbi:MAG TPA: hypothetical protein VL501_06060, partial [Pyrinomonadaceae bacterium]|nr:hypothetical protein [Pyrinomonadaceae bacterium]
MILERFDRNRYTFPILLMVVWTAFGLFFGTQNYIRDVYTGEHPSLTGYLLGWLICGYSWAGLTPLLLRFLRHFSLERLGMSKFLLVHLSSGAVIASGQLAAYVAIASLIALLSGTPARSFVEWYPRLWMLEFRSSYLVYLVIAASVAAYSRVFRTAEKLRPEVQNAEPPASM